MILCDRHVVIRYVVILVVLGSGVLRFLGIGGCLHACLLACLLAGPHSANQGNARLSNYGLLLQPVQTGCLQQRKLSFSLLLLLATLIPMMADPLETLVLPREAGVRAACFCKVWFYTIRQASERGRICALAGHTLLDFQQSNRTSSRVGPVDGAYAPVPQRELPYSFARFGWCLATAARAVP